MGSSTYAPCAFATCACGPLVVPVWQVGTERKCIRCLVEYARKAAEGGDHYSCNRRVQRLQARLDDTEAELLQNEVSIRDYAEEAERLRERLADYISRGEV